ncbi:MULTISPECIES: undecaprenyl-phosphate glucose phosphotransferase [unclassified Aliivibrio]|uniref:undecaprenyl-phosphate glucose phosphotransferase n=1 Tax=unclassified Aliivibrio TaxID=2645654 RepID=UPI00080E14DA|nr:MULTISPECIES: undecaprenyl-phosphate glucose phosphotransferase [unclassified Aliivibrio]OCH13223.1 undecaprenyl-phosphate glucose phosphotransferase [Aliivibrio sp. 1S165]OCH25224.1 undecaprenyl-phosphate glucose phosphotransferase [Aliivibrio sp. 1S128]OCH28087.1 undecaprenyl-phosphate glucose phosphotransferase [Aliivibrio sp. 1S175]
MKQQNLQVMNNSYRTLIKVFDFIAINMILTFILSFHGFTETAIDLSAGLLFSTVYLLISEYLGLYVIDTKKNLVTYLLKSIVSLSLAVAIYSMLKLRLLGLDGIEINNLSPSIYFQLYLLTFVILSLARMLFLFLYQALVFPNIKIRNIAIIGLTPAGLSIEKALIEKYKKQKINIEFYDDRSNERFSYVAKSPYIGTVSVVIDKVKTGAIDDVYIALPMVAKDRIKDAILQLSNSTVDAYIVPDLYTYKLSVSQIARIGNVHTFSIFSSPFEGLGALTKRIEDIVIGSLITLLILPVLCVVALGVKLSSPGPILFKQDRYGLGGKKIKVWKFRSMKVMENSEIVTQATKNDPRVTRFGNFIRRTSLDELPQFINVLQGSMSIVGPRPHAVAHNEEYRVLVDNYMVRHKIKPGITGLAQINGYRGETDTLDKMEKRVEYDIKYLQNWTLPLDIKIIFLTVFKGFVSDTAY